MEAKETQPPFWGLGRSFWVVQGLKNQTSESGGLRPPSSSRSPLYLAHFSPLCDLEEEEMGTAQELREQGAGRDNSLLCAALGTCLTFKNPVD